MLFRSDVGLVGFPNAGKSTFLSRVSAARPKVADYPFTTLAPNLGVVEMEGIPSFVIADIPGLIGGAHEGVGLGHDFLRHVERTRLLIHIIDAAGVDGRSPLEDYRQINEELRLYNARLAGLTQVVVANKLDIPQASEGLALLRQEIGDENVLAISAVTGEGIREVLFRASKLLSELPDTPMIEENAVFTPAPLQGEEERISISRENDVFTVTGKRLEKMVAMTDFNNEAAVKRFQRIFRLWDHEDELKNAGAKNGDTIKIRDLEFTFWQEEEK